jgi:hypothetical protein
VIGTGKVGQYKAKAMGCMTEELVFLFSVKRDKKWEVLKVSY